MSPELPVEQRLAVLEQQVESLQQQVSALRPSATWIERMAGSMRPYPEYLEVLRLGREIRHADRPPDEPAGER